MFGADRPHNVALIVPDPASLRARAERYGIEAPSLDALLAMPAVRALFAQEIEAFSTELRAYERIRAFVTCTTSEVVRRGSPTVAAERRVG